MSSGPVILGNGSLDDILGAQGVALADGNKTADKTTTIFRVKARDGKSLMVQLGKSMEDWVRCTLVNYADMKDDSKTKRVLFANMEDDPAMLEDTQKLVRAVGQRLFDGREAYWGGRVKDSMDFEEFMTRCSLLVKRNRITDANEAVIKCRDANKINRGSRFWHVSNLKKGDDGRWTFTRRPIAKFATSARSFKGLICCSVGAFTGFNKAVGPTWGVFLTVTDACLLPIESGISAPSGAAEEGTMDFFGMADVTTETETSMVLDSVEGDHVATAEDLDQGGDSPLPLTPPKLKRSSTMAPGFHPSKKQTK